MQRIIVLKTITAVLTVFIFTAVIYNNGNNSAFQAFRAEYSHFPSAGGTFLQWWLVKNWDDKRWEEEISWLRQAGMKYIIISPTAVYSHSENHENPVMKTVFEKDGGDYTGGLEICLYHAQKSGMKVFLGLNFSDEWWGKKNDRLWIYRKMYEGNQLAQELWNRYRGKYPDAFYGWYWCWEVDNFHFRTVLDFKNSKEILARAIKIHMDFFDERGMHMPFMLAPYIDDSLGRASWYADLWEYVLENSGMKEEDILCLQDSLGTGGLSEKNYKYWFSEIKRAVDKVKGIRFWADIETFDIKDWTPVTIDIFVRHMKELAPFTEEFITFSYTHYYSPGNSSEGYHKAYMSYLESGVLDNIPPSAPEIISLKKEADGSIILKFNKSNDNQGVCCYYIYRDGEIIAKTKANEDKSVYEQNVFRDDVKSGVNTPKYSVQACDYSGNFSSHSNKANLNEN